MVQLFQIFLFGLLLPLLIFAAEPPSATTPPPPLPPPPPPPRVVLVSLGLNLNAGSDNTLPTINTEIEVLAGQTSHDAVYLFGQEHNVDAKSLFSLKQQLDQRAQSHSDPTVKDQVCTHPLAKNDNLQLPELVAKATLQLAKGQYLKAGQNLLHAVPPHDTQLAVSERMTALMDSVVQSARMVKDLEAFECQQQKFIDVLTRLMAASPKSGAFPLRLAQCYAEVRTNE